MARNQVIVNTATGACRPVCAENRVAVGEEIVVVDRLPDYRTERLIKGALKPATAAQIADYDAKAATDADAKAEAAINRDPALKAAVLAFAELTGKTPAQVLTVVKDKYRSLS